MHGSLYDDAGCQVMTKATKAKYEYSAKLETSGQSPSLQSPETKTK